MRLIRPAKPSLDIIHLNLRLHAMLIIKIWSRAVTNIKDEEDACGMLCQPVER